MPFAQMRVTLVKDKKLDFKDILEKIGEQERRRIKQDTSVSYGFLLGCDVIPFPLLSHNHGFLFSFAAGNLMSSK